MKIMKIISTKKMILSVVTAVVLLSTLPFLQSCSNEDNVLNSNYQSENKTKTINKSDIPLNIGSLKFDSKEEASKFIDEFEKEINQPAQMNLKKNGSTTILSIGRKSNNLSNSSRRFKVPSNETITGTSYLTFDINVNFSYDPSNMSTNPTASVTLSGFHPGLRFVQTASSCTWNTNTGCFDYCVSGNLETYIQVSGEWILYSSYHTYKGTLCN